MLHILLLILKIAGIILLVLLGLLITLFLVITLVPVRYGGRGSFYEKPEGRVKVTWLLHIFSVAIAYREGLSVTVRIFGFRVFKGREEAPVREAEKAAGKGFEELADLAKEAEAADFNEEPMVSVQEVGKPLADPKTELQEAGEKELQNENAKAAEDALPQKDRAKTRGSADVADASDKPDGNSHKTERKLGGKSSPEKNIFHRLWERIKMFWHRLMQTVKSLAGNLKKAEAARQELLSAITDEANKKTFRLMITQGKRLARHVLPGRIKGKITFGFEDPYLMGQILSGAALFYPLYRNQLLVMPVFDRQMIEGELAFRGRIRLGVFLMAGLKILLNKNFRMQLKKFMNRGGM